MNNLENSKNKCAQYYGFQNWKHMHQNSTLTENEKVLNKAMAIYASQQIEDLSEKIKNYNPEFYIKIEKLILSIKEIY